jgi:hypothetical protein
VHGEVSSYCVRCLLVLMRFLRNFNCFVGIYEVGVINFDVTLLRSVYVLCLPT